MRKRVRWGSYMALAITAAWCAVVWIYSLGERRERKRLVARFDVAAAASDKDRERVLALLDRIKNLENTISVLSSSPRSASSLPSDDESPPFRRRVLGWGQSKSRLRPFIYCDVETSPGVVERRYFPVPQRSSLGDDDDDLESIGSI